MTILKILQFPDNRLRKIAKPVKKIDFETKSIINNMFNTMYKNNGIGLAATQVNICQQIIVIDISKTYNKKLLLINPVILKTEGSISIEEGCLSLPNQHGFVPRSKFIKIKSLDINGNEFELEAVDLLSICIQHEIDHLNGKLFIDYISLINKKKYFVKK